MWPQKTDSGDREGGPFLAHNQECNKQINPTANQRGRLEGRTPCSSTDVDFNTPKASQNPADMRAQGANKANVFTQMSSHPLPSPVTDDRE